VKVDWRTRRGELWRWAAVLVVATAVAGCAAAGASETDAQELVARWRERGLSAAEAGTALRGPNPFGALGGEVVEVEGMAVQVYRYPDAARAEQGLRDARTNPVVNWVARPHFARYGSLLVTVVTDDEAKAARITAALG
jgi:hypothetical protein